MTTTSYKALLRDFILFFLLGIILWTINVIAQIGFPGNHLFPFFMRSVILAVTLALCYYLNYKFSRRNELNADLLKFKPHLIKQYLAGVVPAVLLILAIWTTIYPIYPFEIIKNYNLKINLFTDITWYSLDNTLEELLFRGFLLLASIKLFGKISGVFLVSLLFGFFHLQGTGLSKEGLSMMATTFAMSLLFVSVIFYTKSIWTAVTLHITGNILLHTLGFDGANKGLFQIKFRTSNLDELVILCIFETMVIGFALFIFFRAKKINSPN